MTNKEWLDYLAHNAPDELADWFDAEHVETEERALDGETAALEAKIAELTAKLERCENRLGFYRSKLGTCADLSEEIRNVAMGITDEGMA